MKPIPLVVTVAAGGILAGLGDYLPRLLHNRWLVSGLLVSLTVAAFIRGYAARHFRGRFTAGIALLAASGGAAYRIVEIWRDHNPVSGGECFVYLGFVIALAASIIREPVDDGLPKLARAVEWFRRKKGNYASGVVQT